MLVDARFLASPKFVVHRNSSDVFKVRVLIRGFSSASNSETSASESSAEKHLYSIILNILQRYKRLDVEHLLSCHTAKAYAMTTCFMTRQI